MNPDEDWDQVIQTLAEHAHLLKVLGRMAELQSVVKESLHQLI